MQRFSVGIIWLALILAAGASWGATITVNAGGSIQSGINSAVAGDTVLVRTGTFSGTTNLNKSVTLQFEPNVIINGNNSGTAMQINCSSCAVLGPLPATGQTYEQWFATWPQFMNFANGFIANSNRNNVTIRFIKQRNTNYGFWMAGSNWLVEGVEVDRIVRRSCSGDADYARAFVDGLVFRWFWFHGTQIPTDLGPCTGTGQARYSHTDLVQFYNQNGEVLKNALFENGIGEDFVQGFFIGNETGNATSVQNVTVRNVALRGHPVTPVDVILGAPSWTYYFGKNGPEQNIVIENTTNSHSNNVYGILTRTTARVNKNIYVGGNLGTIWIAEGTPQSNVTIADANIHWGNNPNWLGEFNFGAKDIKNVNPNISYANSWAGPDMIPFNGDDTYKTTVAAAQGFGANIPTPMFPTTPPPPADTTPPTITLIGANPLTLAFGAAFTDPGATVTDNVDAARTISGTGNVNTGQAGTYTRTYAAADAAGNAAAAVTRTVIVQAAPNMPPSVTIAPVGPFTLEPGATGVNILLTAIGVDAEGAVSYQWANGPATASWTYVQGVGTARRTVTVADAGGLTATASVDVTVNPAPTPEPEPCVCEIDADEMWALIEDRVLALVKAELETALAEAMEVVDGDLDAVNARIDALAVTLGEVEQRLQGVEARPVAMTVAEIVALIDAAIDAQPTVSVVTR